MFMRAVVALGVAAALAVLVAGGPTTSAANGGSVTFTNQVVSSPSSGGGYPVPTGSRVPVAGTCGPGPFNANYSESWIAVQPGTEDLVGSSKFFFDKYSTFYMFYLGAYQILGHPFQDHVYAAWAVFNGSSNGQGIKVRLAVSRDRGQTFDKAVTISPPSQVGPADTFVYPSIDAAGALYVAFVSFPPNGSASTIHVASSTDDGVSFTPFVPVTLVNIITTGGLANTRFPAGLAESFAASPTYAGHLYLTYEDWDGTQMDVKFTQSTDGGVTWTTPMVVNDNADKAGAPTDQFQPTVAAGPGGAVAVAFYDRRRPCPDDASVLAADVGRTNFCIDVSLQAYKDSGDGAVRVGSNLRISQFTWDPEQPGQHLGGLSQYPCAGARDPCPNGRGFIGDYFGLAISAKNIYALFVSTHYPSNVTADEGGPIYYQQQVLAAVPRAQQVFGKGY